MDTLLKAPDRDRWRVRDGDRTVHHPEGERLAVVKRATTRNFIEHQSAPWSHSCAEHNVQHSVSILCVRGPPPRLASLKNM